MKFTAFAFVLLISTGASVADTFKLDPEGGTVIPSIHARDLLRQCSRGAPLDVTSTWQPTPQDIQSLETRLPNALMATWPNHTREDLNASPSYPRDFARQYGGMLSRDRKIIYVNAFPLSLAKSENDKFDWHVNALTVCDGGDQFWGVEYDPATKTFAHFAFNGAI